MYKLRKIRWASAEWLEDKENWKDIQPVIRYRCTCEIGRAKTTAVHPYISSFDTIAQNFDELIRDHWSSIEDQLH